ncbi:MAG: SPASM domain-containing protein [Candidatus Cloacimonadota bacterium]|nr:SPASM domain-containing protein [Candidatus Cloacimonadota bacterium]
MRKDIVEIITTIYDRSKPKIINIPTNGILTKKIVNDVKKIANHCKESKIIINLSIDGIGYQHDDIRNVDNCFVKVTDTFTKLKSVKIRNLSIGIHTVVSNFNVNDFARISSKLLAMDPDSYITEIAENRVELGTMKSNITPSLLKYKSAIDFLIHRIKQTKYTGMQRITQSFRIEYYQLVKRILRDKKQVIPCYSGFASVQISPDGNIWPCCVKAVNTGNLRKSRYNFRKIWFDDKMKIQRKSIADQECHCPLANASYTNMLMDYSTLFRVFYRSFINWWT